MLCKDELEIYLFLSFAVCPSTSLFIFNLLLFIYHNKPFYVFVYLNVVTEIPES